MQGDDYVGRVVGGLDSATLANNCAWNDMTVKIGSGKVVYDKSPLNIGHNEIDGADMTAENALSSSFYLSCKKT